MAHFADKPHVDWQKIDRVESAVLLCLIGGGLTLCVFGAAAYDIGRAFSVWKIPPRGREARRIAAILAKLPEQLCRT